MLHKFDFLTATSVCVENDIIKWSSAPNARTYVVQIGDESHQASTNYDNMSPKTYDNYKRSIESYFEWMFSGKMDKTVKQSK